MPMPRPDEILLPRAVRKALAGAPPPRRRRGGLWQWIAGALLALAVASVLPVLWLAVFPAFTSSFMLQYAIGGWFDERPPLRHDWVGSGAISPYAKLAVIAAEDQKFPEHFGFDVEAIEKALEHNKRSRRTRGASTISQQTAKNLFLWSGRSWLRKGVEVYYTLLIEALWSKKRVLTVYLNVAEFGEGVYGVQAAAQHYFGKDASRLGWGEAALLAAVLPSPRRYRVDAPSGYVQSRAAWIQGQMRHLGTAAVDGL